MDSRAAQAPKILLVEDDPVDRMAIERLFEQEALPYELLCAGTIAEAMEIHGEQSPELVLVDHGLPDGTGLELQALLEGTACIFITGESELSVAVEAMKSGAFDFLRKDTQRTYVQLLPGVIDRALEIHRLRDDAHRHTEELNELVIARTGELRRSNRALSVLSESLRALVRAAGEDDLLASVCEILVDTGEYSMAWVGLAEQDEGKSVRPAAQVGLEEGCLEALGLTWGDTERGQGPTGTAIRTGRPSVARHVSTDPRVDPRRADALERGYRSSIALPLMSGERAFGALNVYSSEPDAFEEEEQGWLLQLAEEVAYGVTSLRAREAHARGEKALRESERLLTDAQRLAQVGNWELDLSTNELVWSTQIYRMLEMDPEKVGATFEAFLDAIHPDDREMASKAYTDSLRSKTPYEFVHRLLMQDGTVKYVNERCETIFDEGGRPLRSIGTVQDITERKRAQVALEKSEALLAEAGRLAKVGGWELDAKTLALSWTDETHRIHEVPLDQEPPLEDAMNFYHPDDRSKVEAVIQRALEHGEPGDIEARLITAKGKRRWTRSICRPTVVDGTTVKLVGAFQDITERKRMEEEKLGLEAHLRQQQKLEAIGTLASGIAHEINNPINGIMNFAQLIDDRLEPESPLREFAVEIGRETERVSAIVRNLLTFARQEKESHSPARIVDIVNDSISLVGTIIRRDQIALEVDMPDDLPKFKCRSQQIQQVVMNLLTNARDALNERYPEHDPDKIMKVTVRPLEKEDRPWVRVTVEDHGAGVPDEISDRIFDPFFTTKDRTKGTGLGLSISHGIVQDHHGELFFESEAGRCTRFHLDLPVDNDWSLDELSTDQIGTE